MDKIAPKHFIIIGGILMALGVIFPFLMVMRVLNSTMFLNFFSYIAQVVGLFLGMYGVMTIMRIKRKK